MIKENKIITIESNEKFLIIKNINVSNNNYLVGVKLENDKYVNDFRLFKEINDYNIEEIKDENIIKMVIDKYILTEFIN